MFCSQGSVWLFGGQLRDGSVTSYLWRFSPDPLTWSLLGGRRGVSRSGSEGRSSSSRPSQDGGRKPATGRRGVRRSGDGSTAHLSIMGDDPVSAEDEGSESLKAEAHYKSSREQGKSVGGFVSYIRKKYPDLYDAQFRGKQSDGNKTKVAPLPLRDEVSDGGESQDGGDLDDEGGASGKDIDADEGGHVSWDKLYKSDIDSNPRNRWFGRHRDSGGRMSRALIRNRKRNKSRQEPTEEFIDGGRARMASFPLEGRKHSHRGVRVRRKAQTEEDSESVKQDDSLLESEQDSSPGALLFADSPNSIATNLNPGEGGFGGECRRRRGRGGMCAPLAVVGGAALVVPAGGVEHQDVMLVIFGYSPLYGFLNTVQEYHFGSNSWRLVQCGGAVVQGRYGHSAVYDTVGQLVLVHGGLIADTTSSSVVGQLLAYRHATAQWFVLPPSPTSVYLHSGLSFSPGSVLYYGGNSHNDTSVSHSARCYTQNTLLYDVVCGVWHTTLPQPQHVGVDAARYGHNMVLLSEDNIPRSMSHHDGGRGPTGGPANNGASLHSEGSQSNVGVVLSGFNGRMLGSALLLHAGRCVRFSKPKDCLTNYPALKCVWNIVLSQCELYNPAKDASSYIICAHDLNKEGTAKSIRPTTPSSAALAARLPNFASQHNVEKTGAFCKSQKNCVSCLHTSYGCVWCGTSGCNYNRCDPIVKAIDSAGDCPADSDLSERCGALISCHHCHNYHGNGVHQSCVWLHNKLCAYNNNTQPISVVSEAVGGGGAVPGVVTVSETERHDHNITTSRPSSTTVEDDTSVSKYRSCHVPPCHSSTSCEECTSGQCMWCHNEQRCVDNNSYLVSFPYGSCREWTTSHFGCRNNTRGSDPCLLHRSCLSCQSSIECGWCDDSSGTGTGSCLTGGIRGPRHHTTGDPLPPACPTTSWYFTTCPKCNCNGHSHCRATRPGDGNSNRLSVVHEADNTDSLYECVQPCANNTEGRYCQYCRASYYGSAINGGHCTPCFCNEHGTLCDRTSGRCYCSTKGVTGEKCDKCDEQNNYFGDPKNGSCFCEFTLSYHRHEIT